MDEQVIKVVPDFGRARHLGDLDLPTTVGRRSGSDIEGQCC